MLNKKTNEYWFPNMLFNVGGSDFISTICRMDERNNVTYFPLTSDTDLQTILIDILIREQRFTWDTTSVLPKQVRVNPKINSYLIPAWPILTKLSILKKNPQHLIVLAKIMLREYTRGKASGKRGNLRGNKSKDNI